MSLQSQVVLQLAGLTYTPVDESCLCTTRVTNMDDLLY